MSSADALRRARIRGGNTRRFVQEYLREQIVSCALRPGTALSEAEIATQLEVSRTPVRESLLLLSEEGLIDIFPQRGSFVGPIRYEAVKSAQFIREVLECEALRTGHSAIDDEALRELRAIIRRQRNAAAEDNAAEFSQLDEEFHQSLMDASGHQGVWPTVARAKAQMDRTRRLSLSSEGRITALVDEHEGIVNYIEDRQIDKALDLLHKHLRRVLVDIEEIRAKNPDLFTDS